MDRLQRLFGNLPGMGGPGGPGLDGPLVDTAEKVHISSLALLKMLKHGMNNKQNKTKKYVIKMHYNINLLYRSCWCPHGSHGSYVG
jgi:hypothetical protein